MKQRRIQITSHSLRFIYGCIPRSNINFNLYTTLLKPLPLRCQSSPRPQLVPPSTIYSTNHLGSSSKIPSPKPTHSSRLGSISPPSSLRLAPLPQLHRPLLLNRIGTCWRPSMGVERRRQSMPEQQHFQVGRREVGNGAKGDLGVVLDQVPCFAREGRYEEGNKVFLVDMVELRLYL